MASTPTPPPSSYPNTLQFSVKSPSPFVHYLLFRSRWRNASTISLQKSGVPPLPPLVRPSFKKFKCFARSSSTEEDRVRPRDIRSVDPSLFLTKTAPSLLVREHAILLNLGSLRAMAMKDRVLIFNYNSKGGKAFTDTLLPRLNNMNGAQCMPFELEVVEAALLSWIQRWERKLMNLEPRVQALLKMFPNKLTGDILEQLRISKQTLVELGSKAGALRQMLLDLLEDQDEIRRICIMGRRSTLKRENDDVESSLPSGKLIAEEQVEEIEMLLENYLQRCESCHGQAERLLDSAKEMEDSMAVNLSSRRLEVGRVELLLQVGAFCIGVGALVSVHEGISALLSAN
ncbi:hypothetical protein GOBAR_DD32824 [Gossypium barbadense]|nr:hypothetical protein GOBAR_DD32824 [Gossypium barbadense]